MHYGYIKKTAILGLRASPLSVPEKINALSDLENKHICQAACDYLTSSLSSFYTQYNEMRGGFIYEHKEPSFLRCILRKALNVPYGLISTHSQLGARAFMMVALLGKVEKFLSLLNVFHQLSSTVFTLTFCKHSQRTKSLFLSRCQDMEQPVY